MALESIPISGLTLTVGVCKIEVRIVRIWGFPKKDKPSEFSALDLLLIDSKGDRIQASIKPTLMERFKDKIQEDACCVIMNFDLGPNLGQFRSSSHPYKINFIFFTVIKPCGNLPNTDFRYNLCPFPEIVARHTDDSVFVDILGEVVAMNEIKEVSSADGKTKLLNLQLKDLGDSTLDIALWGNLGETVYTDVKNQKSGPVIFLGSLMKTSHYNRRGNAQSSKFATKVFINTSQPEIAKITDILCKGETDMSMAILPVDSSFSGGVAKNSFAISEMKTICELSGVNQDTTCNVLATIVSVGTGNSWFFTGCSTCFKTVTPYFNPITEKREPDKYSCEKCPKAITTTQTRFKLKFQVMDHTGTTTFISFDDVVIPLIKKSAHLLLEEQAQFNRSGQTPPELLDLNGRQFVFKIRLSSSEKFNSSTTYRVVSLIDGHDVIQSFSDCLKTLTGVEQETSPSLAPSAETTNQKVEEHKAITLSGSSLEGAAQSSIMSSEVENLDGSAAEVNIPTPTSKRSLRHSTDEVYQRSSTKPKLMYTVKKEKKVIERGSN